MGEVDEVVPRMRKWKDECQGEWGKWGQGTMGEKRGRERDQGMV